MKRLVGGKEIEEGRCYYVCYIMGHFELAICAGSFCVDHSFGDSFAVEVREEINKMNVL